MRDCNWKLCFRQHRNTLIFATCISRYGCNSFPDIFVGVLVLNWPVDYLTLHYVNKLCGRLTQYAPAPCKLTLDLLTSKVVSESRVTWATSLPMLVFLGLSVLDLDPMYATDRQTDVRRSPSLNAPYLKGGHNKL